MSLIGIMLGGAFGAVMRYVVANWVYAWLGRDFPYGTLSVNIIGSFLMGLLTIIILQKSALDPAIKLGVMVGFLGAFTTFSTFSIDTLNLLEKGDVILATVNVFTSVISCIVAVWLGMLLGKQL
jgi:CrcB protein